MEPRNLDTPHREAVKAAVNSPSNLALVDSDTNQKVNTYVDSTCRQF